MVRQRALRDFGLVGRVGGEKLAARNDRIHQHRTVMVIHAGAEKAGVAVGVFGRPRAEVIDDLVLADFRGSRSSGRLSRTASGRWENRSSGVRRRRRPAFRGARNRTSGDIATKAFPLLYMFDNRRRIRRFCNSSGIAQPDLDQPGGAVRIVVQLFGSVRRADSLISITSPETGE